MHTASQALAIERQASAQPSLAERVSRPKTRAILGLMRLNFLSVREVSGVEHAEADLYSGRQVILTPTERTLTAQLQDAEKIWTALGCRVTSMLISNLCTSQR